MSRNPRNLFHSVGPRRANPRCFNEPWALTRRTRGALRQRGACTSRPTRLRQEHVGPARQDPCFDKSTWVLRVKTHAPFTTVHGFELTAPTIMRKYCIGIGDRRSWTTQHLCTLISLLRMLFCSVLEFGPDPTPPPPLCAVLGYNLKLDDKAIMMNVNYATKLKRC